MSRSLLVNASSHLALFPCMSKLCFGGRRCFDAVNQPESSHWLIGYNYIIRGSWGSVLREVGCRGGRERQPGEKEGEHFNKKQDGGGGMLLGITDPSFCFSCYSVGPIWFIITAAYHIFCTDILQVDRYFASSLINWTAYYFIVNYLGAESFQGFLPYPLHH